jgi:histidyl-tRNA synthetase
MELNKLFAECESLICEAYDKIELLDNEEDQELFFNDVETYEAILNDEELNNIETLESLLNNLKLLVSRL